MPILRHIGPLDALLAASFARDRWYPLPLTLVSDLLTNMFRQVQNLLVWTGSPCVARSFSRLNSFRAIKELEYVYCSEPRLLITSAAE